LTASINIAPVKFSNVTILNRVVQELRLRFSRQINIYDLELDIEKFFFPERSQYYSTQIIADALNLPGNPEGNVLLLTDVDLFIPVLTFVFGEAQLNGTHSIVSVCRLHEEFYSGISNDDLLFHRTMKEVMHELGHNFGLKHCHNWDCVMHSSPGIEEVDIKGDAYCHKCAAFVEGYKMVIGQ
jgi:archaemetzincin